MKNTRTTHSTFSLTKLALLTSLIFADKVWAEQNQALETITVTAQKRVQAIKDVPATISAMNSSELESLGVDRFDELSDLIPGLVVQQQSVNNNGYVIRGITSDDGASEVAPRVSIYLNGTDVSRSRASYFEVYDMQRIEVVKGPQATLFGTAASIGAISFITNKPTEEFEARLSLGAGNYGLTEIEGMVNGGDEKAQARFAFVKKSRDGYVENTSGEADLNGYDRLSIRPSLRLLAGENTTVDLVYTYDEAKDPGTAFVSESVLYTENASLSVPNNNVLGMSDVGINRKVHDFNATATWDISESYVLTYIGAYRDYQSTEVFDADGTEFEFLNFAEIASGDQSSHEVRINYSGDKLNGFFGASYFTEEAEQLVPFATEEGVFLSCLGLLATAGIPACFNDTTPTLTQALVGAAVPAFPYESYSVNRAENDSLSIFADASYAITPALEATFGIRYVEEQRRSTFESNLPISTLATALLGVPTDLFLGLTLNTDGEALRGNADDSVVLPRFNLLYQINNDLNVYATVAKGQRSQVVDLSSGQMEIIPAEEVVNLEAGLKGNNREHGLSYSLAVFQQDYENFQVSTQDEGGTPITENAGNATNIGVEADIRWQVNQNLQLLANVALIDAGIDDNAENGDFAGNSFRLQPETTGAISYIYETPITDSMKITSSGSWSYRSSVFFDIENDYGEDAVDLLSLRVGIAAQDDNWSVNFAVNNLLDEQYKMDGGNTGSAFPSSTGNYATFIEGAPRTFSLHFTKRLGEY